MSMSSVGVEPMIPVFERTKTVHSLDRAAAVVGISKSTELNMLEFGTGSPSKYIEQVSVWLLSV
jgi:hypothetical protein